MKDIETMQSMIDSLKQVKASAIRVEKLSDKAFNMSTRSNTIRQIQSAHTNLNWECMNLDKLKTEFARKFKGSLLDVGVEEKLYNPSGFHSYKG